MNHHRSATTTLRIGASFGILALLAPSAGRAAARDCKKLEQDQAAIAKDNSLRPSLVPGDAELAEAKTAAEDAQTELDKKEQERALQQAARDAAVGKPDNDAATIKLAQDAFGRASEDRDRAHATLREANATVACQERFHLAARNFYHSLGVGVAAAGTADETARVSAALRYQYAPTTNKAWEVSLEAGRFWLPERDDNRDTVMNAIYRWKFGTSSSAFVLGSGIGWLNRRFNGPWENHGFAVLGDVGVEFRIKNSCPSLTGDCWALWPDLRASVQPWVSLDGSPVAILFGVQLGAFMGFQRMSP